MGFSLPESNTVNTVPLVPGAVSIVHPSVVDMGARWNGYRWWRGDTPMPNAYENPSIWGSNDRINWTVPAGLVNPIDPWPGAHIDNAGWFNSDTELVWDPVGQRLVLFWREVVPPGAKYFAASSRDGSTWLHHGIVIPPISGAANMSAGIARDPETGQWRALMFGGAGAIYTAPDALGPWTLDPTPLTGWWLSGDPALPYHGDMIWHDGAWLVICQTRWLGWRAAASHDGYSWTFEEPTGSPPFGGYRPTMAPSTEPGYFDVWGSEPNRYYRMPQSHWLDLL